MFDTLMQLHYPVIPFEECVVPYRSAERGMSSRGCVLWTKIIPFRHAYMECLCPYRDLHTVARILAEAQKRVIL